MIDTRPDAGIINSTNDGRHNRALKARTSASVLVAALAAATALYFGADFFIPITFGLVFTALLWPLVALLKRGRVPTPAGAAISVLGAVAVVAAIMAAFAPPLRTFSNELPRTIAAARPKLLAISATLGRFTGAQPARRSAPPAQPKAKQITDSIQSVVGESAARVALKSDTVSDSARVAVRDTIPKTESARAAGRDTVPKTESSKRAADSTRALAPGGARSASAAANAGSGTASSSGIPSSITDGAPATITHAVGAAFGVLGDFIEVVLLALFILALANHWPQKLALAVPDVARRTTISEVVDEMRSVVSRYLVVTMLINLVQAAIVGVTLHLLGYPSALLWAVLTFLFEFIPYFGGLVMIGMLFLAGLASGKELASALAGPGAYFLITTLQNNLVSPIAYGSRLKLNPAAILAALMLWYMLWGVAGAFLAVPILAAFNVFAERVDSLKGVSAFISD